MLGSCFWPLSQTIKSRLQSAPSGTYSGFIDCASKTIKADGVRALWKGFGPAMTRAFPASACTMPLFADLHAVLHADPRFPAYSPSPPSLARLRRCHVRVPPWLRFNIPMLSPRHTADLLRPPSPKQLPRLRVRDADDEPLWHVIALAFVRSTFAPARACLAASCRSHTSFPLHAPPAPHSLVALYRQSCRVLPRRPPGRGPAVCSQMSPLPPALRLKSDGRARWHA
jgi:hypothetical protein